MDETGGWATSTSGIGRGFSLNVDRINLGVRRFSRFLRSACAKASTENRPLIAAVNRCVTQNQSQDRVFQHSVQRLRKKYLEGAESTPPALKRGHIFHGLNGTSKLVPFPFVEKFEFFRGG